MTAAEPTVSWAARGSGVRGGPVLDLWASVAAGCEPEAAAELAALGWEGLDVLRPAQAPAGRHAGLWWEQGSVYGRADLAGVYATLLAARTVTRVALLLTATEQPDLEGIAGVVRALDLSCLPFAPFAVQAERSGRHPFRSPDLARVAGSAVIDRVRAATRRHLPVDLDAPVSVVRVELSGARLRVGMELTAGSLHRRPYLVYRHMASLKATTAAALLLMAGWRRHERLLDPLCGGGTIIAEAGLAALRRAPGAGSADRLAATPLHRSDLAAEVAGAVAASVLPPGPLPVHGLERYGTHVRGARRNLAAAALSEAVSVRRGDATVLDGVEGVDCIVTNPPYGLRVGSPRILKALYEGVLARAAERLAPGGRVLWLTAAPRVAERAAHVAGLAVDDARVVSLGSLRAVAMRLRSAT